MEARGWQICSARWRPSRSSQRCRRPVTNQPRSPSWSAASGAGEKDTVLLGATGTGKTATVAWLVEKLQRPALVMQPNKTLAAQFANELREMLPNNAVEYFVSYYDYYQPEAYVPQSDTYIEKDSSINEEVERLRHSATNSLLTRRDTIVVASVSCIYGLGTPQEYARPHAAPEGRPGDRARPPAAPPGRHAVRPQRPGLHPGHVPGPRRHDRDHPWQYEELAVRIEMFGDEVEKLATPPPAHGRGDHRGHRALHLPGLPLRGRSRAHGARDQRHRGRAVRRGWPSWRARTSCWRPSACGCGRPTTSR